MRDILLEKSGDLFDISFENGDFKTTEGLDTSIIMSLLTDQRAESSEVSEPSLRRGWLGNEMNEDPDYELGSKLWLLDQARAVEKSVNDGVSFAKEAFEWFLDDQLTKDNEVTGSLLSEGIQINITFVKFDNTILSKQFNLWENTALA